MKLKTILLVLLFAAAVQAQTYILTNPTPVAVEQTVCTREVTATGYDVEQYSIVRLPGGGLQCRATLLIYAGTNTYRMMLAPTQKQIIEALGEPALAAMIRSMGQMAGVVLTSEGSGQ